MEITLDWTQAGMQYAANGGGAPEMRIDGHRETGPSPMQMLLYAVAACSAIDVVDILEKRRQPLKNLRVRATGIRAEGKAGRPWKQIHLIFEVGGEIEAMQIERAITLSLEKYCSVALNLRPTTDITSEYHLV